jgi:rRNA small subunit pseudouridine methyltransferase Nep1
MAKILTILLAEASIELFPEDLLTDIKARQYLSKLKKSANEVLLDMSYHSHLVENLPEAEKRGRPDILHFALLSCFGSILSRDHRLNVIIHTYNDEVIHLHPDIRLPKNIERFNGLLIQLLNEKQVPPDSQEPLMTLTNSSLNDLVNELRNKHDAIIEFSVKGEQMSSSEYSDLIYNATNPLLIFGAYPQGKLKGLDESLVDKTIAIYEEGLDLFAVISQILAGQQMIEEKYARITATEEEKISWE